MLGFGGGRDEGDEEGKSWRYPSMVEYSSPSLASAGVEASFDDGRDFIASGVGYGGDGLLSSRLVPMVPDLRLEERERWPSSS